MNYLHSLRSRIAGRHASADDENYEKGNDIALLGDNEQNDGDTKYRTRTRSCLVNILCESYKVHTDLSLSIHQLAELGNTEAIKIKLKDGEPVGKLDGDQLAPLHYAARYHHNETALFLLSKDANVNIRGQDDRTPLHYAARSRIQLRQESGPFHTGTEQKGEKTSMINLLKDNGADVNAQDKYGQTPLHFAAMTGNLSAAQDLVNCGARVQIEDTHLTTPLIMAATYGHLEMVSLFLEMPDMDFRQADASKQTALHRAAKEGYLSVVQLLLKKAAGSKNFKDFLDSKDRNHKTPLYYATSNGHTEVASKLINDGADVNAETISMATPLHAAAGIGNVDIISLLLKCNVKPDLKDITQKTPLMYAVAGNHADAIKFLLKRGADINERDMNQSTPLLIAAQNGHHSAIQVLLQMQADPRAVDKLERSAIYHCAEQGKKLALQILFKIAKCALKQIDEVDCYGRSPLHVAVMKGHTDIMLLLLNHGATPETKNEAQDTVLHIAAKTGYVSIVKALLDNSCTMLNAENEDMDTPLHLACKWGKEEVARLLLEAGAEVTATNSSSSTPLHLAAFKGHAGCCQILLESDAPIDLFNKENKTPLMLAVIEGHIGVTGLLLDHGASLAAPSKSHMNVLEMAVDTGKRDIALTILQSPGWEKAMKKMCVDERGYRVTPFRRMIEKLPRVAEEVLNKCIKATPIKNDLQVSQEQTITFEYLDDTYESNVQGVQCFDNDGRLVTAAYRYNSNTRRVKKNHPLRLMIKHKLPNLLSHPVCVTLIKHKWKAFRKWVYGNFFMYLIFLIALTTYVYGCKQLYCPDNCSPIAPKGEGKEKVAKDCDDIDWNAWKVPLQMCRVMVFGLAVLELIKEISQFYTARFSYLGWENLVEWIVYICAVLFTIDFEQCPIKRNWQWQLGAASLFLAWMNLLLFIRVFPFFGIYVIMFTEVLKSFCSFFILFFLFIVAFGLSFYTVHSNHRSFCNPVMSLIRTSAMMIGDINFETVFNTGKELEFPLMTYVLLLTFLGVMSILVMNLLVGLAVDDIKTVQDQAILQKLAMKAQLVLDIEMVIPHWLKRKHIIKEMRIMRKGNQSVLGKMLRRLPHLQVREVSEVEELKREVIQLKQSVHMLVDMTSSTNELLEVKSNVGAGGEGGGTKLSRFAKQSSETSSTGTPSITESGFL